MKISTLLSATVIASLLLMTGCANKNMQDKHSGFLKSYDGLEKHEKFEESMVRIMPGSDFTKYENIYVEQVSIVSGIDKDKETSAQKKLYKEISDYLTQGYKNEIKQNGIYTLVEDKTVPKTLVFEVGISAVEVHFDDMQWYQFTPVTLGLTVVARGTYMDAAVRILGEGRLVDGQTQEVLMRAMSLQKGEEVGTEADELVFKDVKPALDAWLKRSTKNFPELRKGIIKYEEKK